MIPSGNYLLLGRTGVGKSSIINAVAQDNIAKTSQGYACTKEIECYQIDSPCGNYIFYDSPGFCEDDCPQTDKNYLNILSGFLEKCLQDGTDISILLVFRLGQTRFYSEDFDVIKYLAEILFEFRLPVVFVATWAEFEKGSDHVRSQLDLLRVQTLLALDRALLEISDKGMCANGFNGAFTVDNNSSTWMASLKPISVRVDPRLESSVGLENLLGHSQKSIFDWIIAAGHNPDEIIRLGVTHLLDNRIHNLTAYPLISRISPVDLISSGSMQSYLAAKKCFRLGLSTGMCKLVDSTSLYASELFRIRSTRYAFESLRDLPSSLQKSIEWLFENRPGHMLDMDESMCAHICALFAAREIAYGLSRIAAAGNIYILSSERLFARLNLFADMFVFLFESMGNVYLSNELIDFVRACLVLNKVKSTNVELLCEHIGRVSSLLYVATLLAEFASFPRSFEDLPVGYFDLVVVNNAFSWCIRGGDSLRGVEELGRRFLSCRDLRDFYNVLRFVSANPFSFSIWLKDASLRLSLNALVSDFSLQNQIVVRQPALYGQEMESEENYWPSWRDDDSPVDVPPIDIYADLGVDCHDYDDKDVDYGYKDDSDYVE